MEQIWHRIFCVHEIMESTAHGVNTGLTLTFIDRCVIITKFNCIPQHHMISKKLIHKDHVMLRNQLHYQGVGNQLHYHIHVHRTAGINFCRFISII